MYVLDKVENYKRLITIRNDNNYTLSQFRLS